MERREVETDAIKTGDRLRKDPGDIEGLAGSLDEHGELRPIVVTRDLRLVAGGRSGQVALPSPAPRFTVECLLELANLLRRLDERAKADAQAPLPVAGPEGQPNHGADRAGGPADPGQGTKTKS